MIWKMMAGTILMRMEATLPMYLQTLLVGAQDLNIQDPSHHKIGTGLPKLQGEPLLLHQE
jgi:hypothetical protein